MTTTRSRGGACLAVLAIAALLTLAVAGCAADSEESESPPLSPGTAGLENVAVDNSETPTAGGNLVVGISGSTAGWDPTGTLFGYSSQLVALTFFDRLMTYDEDSRPVPSVAESVTPSDDLQTWTIVVRPNITFSNEEKLDAEAVRLNLEAHRDSAITGASIGPIEEVVVVDELTVEVNMDRPWATFPHLLTSQVGYMMAPAMVADEARARNPIGSGPFLLDDWAPGSDATVARNPTYWRDGLPYLDQIEFRVLLDVATRSAALEAGDIDAAEMADAGQIVKWLETAQDGNAQIFFDPDGEAAETVVVLNTSAPPFDDRLARELLTTAFDTQLLSDTLYEGLFKPARGPFKPSSPWYVETSYPSFDPDRAEDLAAQYEAKYGGPLAFSLNVPPVPDVLKLAQLAQEQLAAFNIEVDINSVDTNTLLVNAVSGNYEATGLYLFGGEHLDRDYAFLHGGSVEDTLTLSIARMANPDVDEALDAARTTDDIASQVDAYAAVQQGLAEDLRFLWVVHNETAFVTSNSVHGLADVTLPDGSPALRQEGGLPTLTEVWRSD